MIKTLMIHREDGIDRKAVRAQTAADIPNVTIVTMPWYLAALVRAARVYIMTLLGLLGASATGIAPVAFSDFSVALLSALQTAVAPAIVSLLWNTGELLSKLDETRPELRG